LWRADLGLVLLADGVAGRPYGERAASLALATAEACAARAIGKGIGDVQAAREMLRTAFEAANASVLEVARSDAHLARMATTLVAGFFMPSDVVIASVGDSRVYRLRQSRLEQLTSDHLRPRAGVEALSSEDRSAMRPLLRILARAVGDEEAPPDVAVEPVAPGDLFVFCTNGLSDVVSPEGIVDAIRSADSLTSACDALVSAAENAGADDDVTVVLVDPATVVAQTESRR
jgi:protein phosphatase